MIKYIPLILCILIHVTHAQPWQTLSGKRPVVIARGGLSGVFPDSSAFGYEMATKVGLKDAVMFCDLQLTKDSIPFCLSELRLDNTTNIGVVYQKGEKTYNVNGVDVTGYFALDFMAQDLFPNTTLIQNILSRTDIFDNMSPLALLDDVVSLEPAAIWLNVQYDTFYNQHKISPATLIEKYPNITRIQYISSPEINFLRFIYGKIDKRKTKMILKFMQPDAIEPTTKKAYSDILRDLGGIRKFSSGILVPKEYIVPVGKDLYLQPSTSLVRDAHKLGLEVYAYGFANDVPASYNYSYDPTLEYIRFVDNSDFSVDGLLGDFVGTASEAIACIAHNKNIAQQHPGKTLIISHNGASGDFSASTDLAYDKAINDGADIIDCSVQMSKDGVVFCSASPDLTASTTAVTAFITQAITIPEIQQKPGIYSFNLAWSEIQTLKPQLISYQQNMPRNPAAKNLGKFMTLAEFLELAKKRNVPGILINIENAGYLASQKSLDIIKAVTTALKNTSLPMKVLIQSDESSVLSVFKDTTPSYQRVYFVTKEGITSINEAAVKEIKKVADTVMLHKDAVITVVEFFTSNDTHIVKQLHDANISVHVGVMYNEFTTIPFDMFSDPFLNLATFIKGLGVDAVVTDYPATARNYLRSPCLDEKAEYWIQPIEIGQILTSAGPSPNSMPPQGPPITLTEADVAGKPLASVTPSDKQKSGSKRIDISVATLAFCFGSILVLRLCGGY